MFHEGSAVCPDTLRALTCAGNSEGEWGVPRVQSDVSRHVDARGGWEEQRAALRCPRTL